MPELNTEDITRAAKDSLYIAVGLGVIGFQRMQVRRNELTKQIQQRLGSTNRPTASITETIDSRMKLVEERLSGVEERIDAVLDQVEDRLPEQVRSLSQGARAVAKDARAQVRSLVGA